MIEFANAERSPFPAHWGEPPTVERRAAWAVERIRAEAPNRVARLRRALERRYFAPTE